MIENQMFEDQQMQPQEQAPVQENTPKKKKSGSKFLLFVVVVVIIAAAIFGVYRFVSGGGAMNGYYAVFLDNNQVYFGNLSHKESTYVTLEDVYYLRVTQVLQNTEDGKQVTVPDINLVKLGTELHKPEDMMEIQKDHILFIEKLKSDSDIINAINTYKQKLKDDAAAATEGK